MVPRTKEDLTRQRFGECETLARTVNPRGRTAYQCLCNCGAEFIATHTALKLGQIKSCGCANRRETAARNRASAKHGLSSSPTFICWVNMIQRCTNSKHKSFKRYGGRGITVCEDWLSFENFLRDMGEKSPGLELDRVDNARGYAPDNCRWATRVENANNRDVSRRITFRGRTQNLKQWAAELGCSHQTIAYRLKAGWSIEEALTRPLNHSNGWTRGVKRKAV